MLMTFLEKRLTTYNLIDNSKWNKIIVLLFAGYLDWLILTACHWHKHSYCSQKQMNQIMDKHRRKEPETKSIRHAEGHTKECRLGRWRDIKRDWHIYIYWSKMLKIQACFGTQHIRMNNRIKGENVKW